MTILWWKMSLLESPTFEKSFARITRLCQGSSFVILISRVYYHTIPRNYIVDVTSNEIPIRSYVFVTLLRAHVHFISWKGQKSGSSASEKGINPLDKRGENFLSSTLIHPLYGMYSSIVRFISLNEICRYVRISSYFLDSNICEMQYSSMIEKCNDDEILTFSNVRICHEWMDV